MLHLLGDGIFPHVAPASVELQALGGHPVLEVRRPGGKTGNIREYQQPGLFVRSDKLVNTNRHSHQYLAMEAVAGSRRLSACS